MLIDVIGLLSIEDIDATLIELVDKPGRLVELRSKKVAELIDMALFRPCTEETCWCWPKKFRSLRFNH